MTTTITTKTLILPTPNNIGGTFTLECTKSVLLIGANGAGKTRLGTWIEFQSPQKDKVHRISAQKSLNMPDSTTPTSINMAESNLLYGTTNTDNIIFSKQHNKFGNNPATHTLNDYEKLMVYLFSESTEENAKYVASARLTTDHVSPPLTKLDKVKLTWEKVLAHRELILGGLRIQTKVKNTESIYKSSDMSDGERVIFYLIGQCLAAPTNGIIIIDEPELHLHKSVQAPLWSEIENLRSDCLFVYLTHDVDFAATQIEAQRIWLKSFNGNTWDWELLNPDQNLPDTLLLEVIGSRKPVVFVEGIKGGYDSSLYTKILSNFLVIPVGSCAQVIQSVKALKANTQLHNLEVYGIVDRDRRVPNEITSLERASVFVLHVAEVENLFLTKELIQIISEHLIQDSQQDFQAISTALFTRLSADLEAQVSLKAASEIQFQLNKFNEKAIGEPAITLEFNTLISKIDVPRIYNEILASFNDIILRKDYDALLELYNNKGLLPHVSSIVCSDRDKLPKLVLGLLAQDIYKTRITEALKRYFGNFAQYIN